MRAFAVGIAESGARFLAGRGASLAGRARVLPGQSGMACHQDSSMAIGAALSGPVGSRASGTVFAVVFMPLRPG